MVAPESEPPSGVGSGIGERDIVEFVCGANGRLFWNLHGVGVGAESPEADHR